MALVIERERDLAQRGDDRLSQLYAQHAPMAKRFAFLLCGDAALAEDIVHEAFVKVGGRLFELRDVSAFPAYLRTTIRNQTRMHARSVARERARVDRLPERQRAALVC